MHTYICTVDAIYTHTYIHMHGGCQRSHGARLRTHTCMHIYIHMHGGCYIHAYMYIHTYICRVDASAAMELASKRPTQASVFVVPMAEHLVYVDNPAAFNEALSQRMR